MVTIATVNVNGIRAAYRKGMAEWLANTNADIVTLQEVRAERSDVEHLVDDGWHIAHDEASQKGRAGVAVLSRTPFQSVSTNLGPTDLDTSGRWLEAVVHTPGGTNITVVSAYVHSGEAGTAKQDAKYAFLAVMDERMAQLGTSGRSVVTGDFNIGHRTLDIKNWKGNLKNAGFLPEERAYLDKWVGGEDDPDYNTGAGNRFVDVGRRAAGDVDGPYSWWSYRGKAFDTDTGWRIDYQLATPDIAHTLADYRIDRAPSYDTRWSDHAPVVATYAL
jgi:exodeoxyribonuclease III